MYTLYVYYKVNIPLIYTLILSFQPLLLDSRLMTSYHITTVICLFIVQKIRKIENKRKIKIKIKIK